MLDYLRKTWQVYWFGMKVCVSVDFGGVGEQGETDSLLIKMLHIALIPFNYGKSVPAQVLISEETWSSFRQLVISKGLWLEPDGVIMYSTIPIKQEAS